MYNFKEIVGHIQNIKEKFVSKDGQELNKLVSEKQKNFLDIDFIFAKDTNTENPDNTFSIGVAYSPEGSKEEATLSNNYKSDVDTLKIRQKLDEIVKEEMKKVNPQLGVELFNAAVKRLNILFPQYAVIFNHIPQKVNRKIPTLCVTRTLAGDVELWYNPEFIIYQALYQSTNEYIRYLKLTDKRAIDLIVNEAKNSIVLLLAHEMSHIYRGHLFQKSFKKYPHTLCNIVEDACINLPLEKALLKSPMIIGVSNDMFFSLGKVDFTKDKFYKILREAFKQLLDGKVSLPSNVLSKVTDFDGYLGVNFSISNSLLEYYKDNSVIVTHKILDFIKRFSDNISMVDEDGNEKQIVSNGNNVDTEDNQQGGNSQQRQQSGNSQQNQQSGGSSSSQQSQSGNNSSQGGNGGNSASDKEQNKSDGNSSSTGRDLSQNDMKDGKGDSQGSGSSGSTSQVGDSQSGSSGSDSSSGGNSSIPKSMRNILSRQSKSNSSMPAMSQKDLKDVVEKILNNTNNEQGKEDQDELRELKETGIVKDDDDSNSSLAKAKKTLKASSPIMEKPLKVNQNLSNWKVKLRALLTNYLNVKEEYRPNDPSRRLEGAFGSSADESYIGRIVLMFDNSGSMSANKYRLVISEIDNISKIIKHNLKVEALYWASDGDYYWEHYTTLRGLYGRVAAAYAKYPQGGTDFSTAVEMVKKRVNQKTDCIIVFTDGEFFGNDSSTSLSYIRRNKNKLIWVVTKHFSVNEIRKYDSGYKQRLIRT